MNIYIINLREKLQRTPLVYLFFSTVQFKQRGFPYCGSKNREEAICAASRLGSWIAGNAKEYGRRALGSGQRGRTGRRGLDEAEEAVGAVCSSSREAGGTASSSLDVEQVEAPPVSAGGACLGPSSAQSGKRACRSLCGSSGV
ncbi:hypothetical protein IG631_09393 [Alternaria alternata]|nr:hypothetical protein IG631_09393 [Alternaria alternata]